MSIYRILTENLGYIEVCDIFVPHTLNHTKKTSEFNIQETSLKRQKIIETSIRLMKGMKGKRYADLDVIQKASTAILNAIPKDDLKRPFDNLLDRANHCIQYERDYFEGDQ